MWLFHNPTCTISRPSLSLLDPDTSEPETVYNRIRLLHSPSLVAIGLSVGYETWHPIGWHRAVWLVGLNIDGDFQVPHCIMGSRDQWEFPVFSDQFLPFVKPQWKSGWKSLCTALPAGKCLPIGLCKGTVKEYTIVSVSSLTACTMSHRKL